MPSVPDLQVLTRKLSSASQVLSNVHSSYFQERLKRWSDLNLQIPGAIVLVRSEEGCATTIEWAASTNTPFVCKSGGMSLYSTIGENGIVIDLSEWSDMTHDKERHEATLVGGISSKEVATRLAEDGYSTTLPLSNPVAAIPFFINGGNSILVSKLGYASDNIISARMVAANGSVVEISETENPDLLYAIRGAGQYFGVAVSLTIRTYPVREVFGNNEGKFWSGRFVFPIDRVKAVAEAMQHVVNDDNHCTGGLIMIAAPPPTFKPAVLVTAKLIHPESNTVQNELFAKLYDLEPLSAAGGLLAVENNADALQPLMAPGDYKKLRLTGIPAYGSTALPEIARLWQNLTTTSCPDAAKTMSSIQWESQFPVNSAFESANSLHDVRFWANNITWYSEPSSQEAVQRYLEDVIAVTRRGQKEEEYVDFTNSVRGPESPVERRYRGRERLERLRGLKQKWDPRGLFSKEFLYI